MTLRWTDNHCHLAPGHVGAETAADAAEAGVTRLITVGTDLDKSRQAIASAAELPGVWATAGVHPHDADGGIDGLAELLAHPKVVAVGETGLDYFYDHSDRAAQRAVFAHQIALAHERSLALVIHSRSAWDDTFDVLDAEGVPERTVFHCFTGGPDEARRCLDRGALLSISGIVTFPSAQDVRDAVAMAPLDRLMVETDSPYLAPVPHRGKPNRPALVAVVGAKVAEVKGVAVDEVAAATWATTTAFYQLRDQD
jgi:TatD DNase family protein